MKDNNQERQVFAVIVERKYETELLIEAATWQEAERHAEELMDGLSATEFDNIENEAHAFGITPVTPKPGEVVWRGGEHGGWEIEPERGDR